MVIILSAGEARLRLSGDADWCDVRLENASQEIELGADSAAVVLERIAAALADDFPTGSAGQIDGLDVAWVVSLSEHHTSMYVATSGSDRVLLFEDAAGKVIGRVELDEAERGEWAVALRKAVRDSAE